MGSFTLTSFSELLLIAKSMVLTKRCKGVKLPILKHKAYRNTESNSFSVELCLLSTLTGNTSRKIAGQEKQTWNVVASQTISGFMLWLWCTPLLLNLQVRVITAIVLVPQCQSPCFGCLSCQTCITPCRGERKMRNLIEH